MNGVDLRFFGDAHDIVDIEIRLNRLFARANQVAFIGLEAVQCKAVFGGINSDGANAHFCGSAHHANGNLASIGDKNTSNGLHEWAI